MASLLCTKHFMGYSCGRCSYDFDPLNDCPICGTKLEGGVSV